MDERENIDHSENGGSQPQRLLAVGLISLAGLVLEISLTRLFSVLFFPPAVFGILSLAIFGIGLGAALVTWRAGWRVRENVPFYLSYAAVSVVIMTAVATLPTLQITLFGLVLLPYLFIGMSLTTLFSDAPQRSPQLYLADLLGAGLGALLAVPLLNWLGGLDAVLATAVLLALAGWVCGERPLARLPLVFLGLTLLVFASSLLFPWLSLDMNNLPTEKPIADSLMARESAVIDTRWDAFARTDLVDPGDGGPYRLYLDGAAGSVMPPAVDNDFLWEDIGFFPFATEQPARVFLIGPGGGLDVWFALQSGAAEIVGVEVNPASVALVAEYAAYNGALYEQPEVNIIIEDGRSVLQRDGSQYDLIFLSQLVTLAAERNGYALVENEAYTVEAFGEYLDHLTPDGQIGIKLYDEPTLTRALSTALAALQLQGLADSDQAALQHILALLDTNANPPIPLLLIRKAPFSREDSLSLGAVAQQVGFTPLFLPDVLAQPPLDGVASGAVSFADVIAESDNDLSPTTDNRPFFYQFERGIPASLRPLLWGVAVVLLVGLVLVIWHQRRTAVDRLAIAAPIYFAGLGLGFILVEIGIIQQTRLFLGHPTMAVTVVLATLLIGGGLGSGLAGRWQREASSLTGKPLLAIIVVLALWLLLWPRVQGAFIAAPVLVRTLVVIATLLPLGLVMGMPFPLGLRAVAVGGEGQVALAWAVNGVMSVVGSVLAVAVAILWGFTAVLLIGGLAYGIVAGTAVAQKT
ncbi:MAG: hypothetical protein CL608_18940 [Anaerolineaceae bacterium]|nr:hypothetical protein [Anaerolineaceae bacterium]